MAQYATRAELYQLAIPSAALTGISSADQDAALESASRVADSYLGTAFELPLTLWGVDLKEAVAKMAAYRLMAVRGFSPEAGDAEQFRLQYQDAVKWLEQVAKGLVRPIGVVDASGGENDTDATGNAADVPFVTQPVSETITPGDFWEGAQSTVSPPKKRGW